MFRIAGAVLLFLTLSQGWAYADDWVATRLRGEVVQLVGDQWVRLLRNDVVSDDRIIRTAGTGRVTFERDAETIELGPNTQIRIHDRAGHKFTVVEEHFGTVSVEAEAQNVEHFAVVTPMMAAVVKGTKFIVTASDTGSSVVVTRGSVAIEQTSTSTRRNVVAGEAALVGKGRTPVTVVGKPAGHELSGAEIAALKKLEKAAAKKVAKGAKMPKPKGKPPKPAKPPAPAKPKPKPKP